MKPKKLKKKIQQLEKRLREGPAELARLKRKLQQAESAKVLKAARRSAARATAISRKEVSGGNNRRGETEQCQESQEKIESFTGTPCATCCRNESQVGCEEGRCGE